MRRRDSFSLKLFRHIIGMANSGGGWIVIGFKEDRQQGFIPDPNHSSAICQSYDTTRLAKRVNSLLHQSDDSLKVYVNQVQHPETKVLHPIIQVEGFAKGPFFTKRDVSAEDTKETILRQNALYVRRPGAETVALSNPADWERLIDRCVKLRREKFLRELEDLLNRMGITVSVAAPAEVLTKSWIEEMRHKAIGQLKGQEH